MLNSYLKRLEIELEPGPTSRTLAQLHRRHLQTIPFENIDVLLKRPVRLDLDSLCEKLIQQHRGAYCFEQNTLFAEVLRQVGFTVRPLAARVLLGGEVRPRSHMLLEVIQEGRPWIADVGFGGPGFLDPIPLSEGEYGAAPTARFALERDGEEWTLSSSERGPLYSFGLEKQLPVDFEQYNYFVSHHPRSLFTNHLVVQRHHDDGAEWLFDLSWSRLTPRGLTTETVDDRDDFEERLGRFGLALDHGALTHLYNFLSG